MMPLQQGRNRRLMAGEVAVREVEEGDDFKTHCFRARLGFRHTHRRFVCLTSLIRVPELSETYTTPTVPPAATCSATVPPTLIASSFMWGARISTRPGFTTRRFTGMRCVMRCTRRSNRKAPHCVMRWNMLMQSPPADQR